MRIEVDRSLCSGYERCVDTAPGVFDVDGDGLAYVVDASAASPEDLVAAARSCPLSAIRVWDADGTQLAG